MGGSTSRDQQHAEVVVRGSQGSGNTMGRATKRMEEEDRKELEGMELREFRALAARANDLAMDRPDTNFATKEVRRGTARPNEGDWRRLKRLGRYLVGGMGTVLRHPWQGQERKI